MNTVIALVAALLVFLIADAAAQQQLVVYHWWTAGGERQAMQKIFDSFRKKNPTIKMVDNPVVGGGGITLKTVLRVSWRSSCSTWCCSPAAGPISTRSSTPAS